MPTSHLSRTCMMWDMQVRLRANMPCGEVVRPPSSARPLTPLHRLEPGQGDHPGVRQGLLRQGDGGRPHLLQRARRTCTCTCYARTYACMRTRCPFDLCTALPALHCTALHCTARGVCAGGTGARRPSRPRRSPSASAACACRERSRAAAYIPPPPPPHAAAAATAPLPPPRSLICREGAMQGGRHAGRAPCREGAMQGGAMQGGAMQGGAMRLQ